jgi:hypothetical protein
MLNCSIWSYIIAKFGFGLVFFYFLFMCRVTAKFVGYSLGGKFLSENLFHVSLFISVSRIFCFWNWEVSQIIRHSLNSHKRSLYSNAFVFGKYFAVELIILLHVFVYVICLLKHSMPPLMESCRKDFPFITRNHHVTFPFPNLPITEPSNITFSREMELTCSFFYEQYVVLSVMQWV